MNLIEILLSLRGYVKEYREKMLEKWGVDAELRRHIEHCFDDDGMFVEALPSTVNRMGQLGDDTLKLDGFDGVNSGSVTVKCFKMHSGRSGFTLYFKRGDKDVSFCVEGFQAKTLAAYIALWA